MTFSMKRAAWPLRVTLALLLAGCAGAPPAPRAPVPLRLIGINDFHGNLEAASLSLTLADPQGGKPLRLAVGGAPALAGMVKTLRAGAPNSVLLSAGDLFGASPLVSTLFRHESTVEVMNLIGLELDAVGNHEFDAGITELKRLEAGGCAVNTPDDAVTSCALHTYGGTRFPLLASNVRDAQDKPPFAPYVVKSYGGIPVAFIGAVTTETPSIVMPSGIAGLRFGDEADAVNRSVQELKAKGVKAMVAVFHEGGELGTNAQRGDWNDTRCADAHGPIFRIAKRLAPEVGVIFSGHSHQGYRCVVDGRVLIQGTSYGRGISVVDMALDPATGSFVPTLTQSINLPVVHDRTDPATRERLAAALPAPYATALRDTRPDVQVAQLVARYAELTAPKASRPVGRIGGAFTRSGNGDSAAGRLIADAQLAATRDASRGGAQIAFMNPGGIRSDLECATPPCTVTFGQAFTMQPFGNSLVVMTLTGAELKVLMESQQRAKSAEPSFLQPSAGFTYTWTSSAAAGERVSDMRLDGVPIDPARSYRITVNSFLADAGDGFVGLSQGRDRTGGGQDIDALIAYLAAGERSPVREPRIARRP
jgi:5'-nucleotidase